LFEAGGLATEEVPRPFIFINKSPQNICCSFFETLSIMKVFSLPIHDPTQPNRTIITTKVFSCPYLGKNIHSAFSLEFVTGLTLRAEIYDDH